MSDTSLNKIIQYGTSTDRIAFTPDPAAGSQVLYLWYETDNAPDTFAWDGSAWVQINTGGGGGGSATAGAYASLPGTCAVGAQYYFTDSVYTVAVCLTTNVWTLFLDGKIAVPPGPKSGWTNVNAGSELTVTDGAGTIEVAIAQNNSLNVRGIVKTATPATITVAFRTQMIFETVQNFGVHFYDGTKLMGLEILTQASVGTSLRVQKWNSVTSASTTVFALTRFGFAATWGGLVYLKLTNGGGNLAFLWSIDGVTFHQVFSEAVGTFLTPTGYGVMGVNLSAGGSPDPLTVSLQSVVTT